jgi:hypothetical protein
MAKKKSKKVSDNDGEEEVEQDQKQDEGEPAEEEKVELFQVELGDIVKVKQVLDETVAMAIADHLPEDFYWDNVKLWM